MYEKILALRAEHDAAWTAYKQAEDEFRAWRDKDRQRKCALITCSQARLNSPVAASAN